MLSMLEHVVIPKWLDKWNASYSQNNRSDCLRVPATGVLDLRRHVVMVEKWWQFALV